ncbi:MAG TPA: allantoate amidohydrolase [Candidatus Sulfotelmatobacter sp.]|nr:allantoate amidohydrolase [Candidatus Sulfotelmatobacter sp.]
MESYKTKDIANLAEVVMSRCGRLASFSEESDSLRRTFLSPPMRDVHREIAGWLEPLGIKTRVDAAGNLRAVYPAAKASAPRLLIGSHLDTVPNAGAYDGSLGVVLAVALLEGLGGRSLPYAIEVVGFSEEEGVRFGAPFIGSRALVGRLDESLLESRDSFGVSVRKAIEEFGLNPGEIAQASLHDEVCGYLEFHIEQGPVLEKLGLPLAVVEAIAGQSRLEFNFVGHANHAGTTPMDLRFDAMAGAAEWITLVERTAKSARGLVATVGLVETKPGAVNVIAEKVRVSLDLRHRADDVRTRAVEDLTHQAQKIAHRRGLTVSWSTLVDQKAVAMAPSLSSEIEEAIRKTGCAPHRMVSGAGHDAMILAERVPAATIFLRSPGGISHHPAESVAIEDVAKAIECGLHLLDQLAASTVLHTRTCRA